MEIHKLIASNIPIGTQELRLDYLHEYYDSIFSRLRVTIGNSCLKKSELHIVDTPTAESKIIYSQKGNAIIYDASLHYLAYETALFINKGRTDIITISKILELMSISFFKSKDYHYAIGFLLISKHLIQGTISQFGGDYISKTISTKHDLLDAEGIKSDIHKHYILAHEACHHYLSLENIPSNTIVSRIANVFNGSVKFGERSDKFDNLHNKVQQSLEEKGVYITQKSYGIPS